MKLVRVYAVDDDGERVGVNHAAWWDGESYWLICGTANRSKREFKMDGSSWAFTGCVRCRGTKLLRLRKVRQMAIDYGMGL